jgi:hypothetical protein
MVNKFFEEHATSEWVQIEQVCGRVIGMVKNLVGRRQEYWSNRARGGKENVIHAGTNSKGAKGKTLTFEGHVMAQAVSRRPLTAEAQVHAWVNPCGICGGQSGTGTGFLRVFGFPRQLAILPVQ